MTNVFRVSDDCRRLGLRAGAVVFRDVRVAETSDALRAEIALEIEAIRSQFSDGASLRRLPEVVAFRALLAKVGVNPKKEQPSVERLLGHALKRGSLPAINSLVDAYNLISIRSRCSMGAHDLDLFSAPATLRLLTGRETFTPLGKTEPVPVTPGEYGYVDAAERVLCRLDLLQADVSKVTKATRNALLIIEGTTEHAETTLRQAFADAAELIPRHCGGTAEVVAVPWRAAGE
jgi:DNA/RNA-binding domain of Phe-tRNA-synthetase-like protein